MYSLFDEVKAIGELRKRGYKITEPGNFHRWWKYAVLRGEGIPVTENGKWYDLEDMSNLLPKETNVFTLEATNKWEQRDDGAVAVVYEWKSR
jgi:biotin operon repressor